MFRVNRVTVCFSLICIMFVSALYNQTAIAYEEIDYWYSNEDSIGTWVSIPTIRGKFLGCSFSAPLMENYFNNAFNHSRQEWASAGINTTFHFGTITSANIACYGGTRTQIQVETGVYVDTMYAGLTTYSCSFLAYLSYGGAIKKLYKMSTGVKVLLPYRPGVAEQGYKNVMLHELGHALGWIGHSTNNGDVMYSFENGNIYLTLRDKRHLKQV